jgi:DNA polymerase III subunit epsilon
MLNWLKNPFKRDEPRPAFWQAYEEHFVQSYHRHTPLADVRFVVFDTETTGLDLRRSRILSIGAIGVQHWQADLTDSLECYVQQPGTGEGEEAIEVHGILPNERHYNLSEAEAVQRFLAFCQDAVLVGHHVSFDLAMVNNALKRMGGKKLLNKQVDTIDLARRIAGPELAAYRQGAFGLDALCQQYRIPLSDRHTAAGDAYITAVLLMKLLSRLEKRGVDTLGQLLRGGNKYI